MVEARKKPLWQMPSPFLEMLFSEIKYRNFGFHGAGIASAADQLAAVKKYVFDEKTVTPARLLEAIESNFENDPELLHLLRYEAPKMGNDDDFADAIATQLLDSFAEAFKDFKKKVKSIFSIFQPLDADNDDKQIDETKKAFELRTFIHDLYKKLTTNEKDLENGQ